MVIYYKNVSRVYRSIVKQMDDELVAYKNHVKGLKSQLAVKMTNVPVITFDFLTSNFLRVFLS